MSESTTTTPGAPSPQHHRHHSQHHRRRPERIRLPTPPPDPALVATRADDDFLAYLDSLHSSGSLACSRTATFAPAMATEDAFDHLERLYKLMEQMLELREQNARLHRRVRDLEHLNNLEKMHRRLEESGSGSGGGGGGEELDKDLDKDTAFAETILESILAGTRAPKRASARIRHSISRRRRGSSISESQSKQAKISKWTKVKAAFRWERASPTVGDARSQDSGIGGMQPVNLEVARYLRVPSTNEDGGHSPADSGAAEISTPGSLSTTSSMDDLHRNELRNPSEDLKSSDDEHSQNNYIPHSKEGSQKSHKSHKTPWAKMKDIIQTRNSFKKKHRLSAQSDDIQIDVELCSDAEDAFDEENKNRMFQLQTPSPLIYKRMDSSEVSPEIFERYQKAAAEDGSVAENADSKKISKWTRVKKAFLPPNETHQQNTSGSIQKESSKSEDESKVIQAEIQRNYKQLQKKLSLEFQEKLSEWERMKQNSPGTSNPSSASCGFVDENRDPAFMKKMEEWQRIKSQPSTKNRPNFALTCEENLPPEFRKKLQEWEKIRKNSHKDSGKKKLAELPKWKSMGGPRPDNSPTFEPPQLSDDFRKKLEEWRQIKAGIAAGTSESSDKKSKDVSKSSSPRLTRKNSSPKHNKKQKDVQDKELQWFEKELGKIEKEKQRLERERQKFLEREERLAKLRNSIIGGHKKEIFIHTPSGFHRFEGISRKFTQKLYEWEKAQGIAPEFSTFALLHSSVVQEPSPYPKITTSEASTPLTRSKSADSITISALNLTCPLMSHQPSSLSLNDIENLEKECLSDSKMSSMHFINQSHEMLPQDEPEALIVEVEDIIEETAAPLRTFTQKSQQPVYQRQELKAMCEGETLTSPKIRRSESTRAQTNYNLIEEIINLLRSLTENELEIQKTQDNILETMENKRNNGNILKLQTYDESQKAMANRLNDKVIKLQEANTTVFANLTKENSETDVGHVLDALETIQDLSAEILHHTEKLETEVNSRNIYDTFRESGARSLTPILEIIKEIRNKMLELRRRLSYICAASDLTAPGRKLSTKKKFVKKTSSNESKETGDNSRQGSEKSSRDGRLYIKADSSNVQSQGAIKKRIRYRQKNQVNRSLVYSDDEDDITEQKRNPHKKLVRTRSVSESGVEKSMGSNSQEVDFDESLIQKIVVPTQTNYVNIACSENTEYKAPESPVTVLVKTTRKIFTPFVESTIGDKKKNGSKNSDLNILVDSNTSLEKPQNSGAGKEEVLKDEKTLSEPSSDTTSEKTINSNSSNPVAHLPPLPASPTVQRKVTKDISPSIRVMLAKYNQKLSEQDSPSCRSGGSSASVSPVPWRSPTSERRVKAQTERYQEELSKLSPTLTGRREVQKSASVGILSIKPVPVFRRESVQDNLINKSSNDSKFNILKSSSASVLSDNSTITNQKPDQHPRKHVALAKKNSPNLKLKIDTHNEESSKHSPEIRQKKLQKAKEEFLNSTPSTAPITDSINYPGRNRLSQISVDSESSYDSACAGALIKSASAGMINIDVDAYKQFNPEIHGGGYVSLPRDTKKQKDGLLGSKFAFANIASKFRKVKMRRGKDREHNRMNVVSTLCRQSLLVDINQSTNSNDKKASGGGSNELPPDGSQSPNTGPANWIKKTKFFKK